MFIKLKINKYIAIISLDVRRNIMQLVIDARDITVTCLFKMSNSDTTHRTALNASDAHTKKSSRLFPSIRITQTYGSDKKTTMENCHVIGLLFA